MVVDDSSRPGPWELTAPESYVLRYGTVDDTGAVALKLAVQELVLRGGWRMTVGHGRLGARRWEVAAGTGAGAQEPSLAPVLALRDGEPLTLVRLARRSRRTFGARLRGYADEHVAPALEARGLLAPGSKADWAGRRRYARTPAGEEADATLDALLARGRRGVGRPFLADAGMAALLLAQAYPELRVVETIVRTVLPADGDLSQAFAIAGADASQGLDAAFDALGTVLGGSGGGGGGDGDGGGGGA